MGMSRERSLEQFKQKLEQKLPGTVVIEFSSMSEMCRVRHEICGAEYEFKPSTLRDRAGCPVCSSASKARTHEELAAKVAFLTSGTYALLDEPQWESAAQAVRFRHSCGHEFECSSRTMLNAINEGKLPCRACGGRELLTNERFASILQKAGDYILVGTVSGTGTPVLIRHDACGHEWEVRPGNFINRKTRCPKCANARRDSKGARAVGLALAAIGLPFVEEAKLVKNPRTGRFMPLDFYIPSLCAAIEYDGAQHDPDGKPFPGRTYEAVRELDVLKNHLCAMSNIHLLRIHHSVGWGVEAIKPILRRFTDAIVQSSDMVISSEATPTEWNVQRLSKALPPLGGSE